MSSTLGAILTFAQRGDYLYRDPNRFGQYNDQIVFHPLSLAGLLIAVICLFTASRRWVVLPIICVLVFIPTSHRLMLGSIDFQFIRILGLVAIVRASMRGEFQSVAWNKFDLTVVCFVSWPVFTAIPRGAPDSLMNVIGQGFDFLSMYLVGRLYLADRRAWSNFAVGSFVLAVPVLVAFTIEKFTGRNYFSIFGGVDEFTPLRHGKLRAAGAFAHPILAGVWWAAMIPIFVSMAKVHESRFIGSMIAVLGSILALILAMLTASSTPIGGALLAIPLLFIFPYRWMLYRARWGIIAGLVLLHFVTQSGLHGLLLTRFTLVSGSTGYHRYRLIDAAIDRIPEWFLFGTRSTYSWGWGLDDVTCQYVAAAVIGGIIGLVLLVRLIWGTFSAAWSIGAEPGAPSWQKWLSWGILVSMAVHVLCFVAVTYFGEVIFLWAATMGGAISLRQSLLSKRTSAVHQPRVASESNARPSVAS